MKTKISQNIKKGDVIQIWGWTKRYGHYKFYKKVVKVTKEKEKIRIQHHKILGKQKTTFLKYDKEIPILHY